MSSSAQAKQKKLTTRLLRVAINFLKYRPRFQQEIIRRLEREIKQKKLSIKALELIPEIIQQLEKARLLNDEQLVKDYITQQLKQNLRGPHSIRPRLFRLGAPKELVNSILPQLITSQDQLQAIDQLLSKPKYANNTANYQKLYRLLSYQGFDFQLIKQKLAMLSQKE